MERIKIGIFINVLFTDAEELLRNQKMKTPGQPGYLKQVKSLFFAEFAMLLVTKIPILLNGLLKITKLNKDYKKEISAKFLTFIFLTSFT